MKSINLLCLLLIILSTGCSDKERKGATRDIRSGNKEEVIKCNHYKTCYQNDMYYTSTCMKWDIQWSKEGMEQLQKVALLKQCYRDKDKIRDECYGTDSKEVRLSKFEECKKIGINFIEPNSK